MLLTIIVFYSFIVRCLKRENKLVAPGKLARYQHQRTTTFDCSSEVTSASTTSSNSVTSSTSSSSSSSSSATTSIAYNHFNKSILKETLTNRDHRDPDKTQLPAADAIKKAEDFSDDEVADDNQFDEEEFYNIIATKASAFQSKRNSSTSTVSSGSMYDDTYRTKRNSLRSQSSTCSDIVETSVMSSSNNRRSSEESCRTANRTKLNYKTRRHGFTTLSKRRRTTGRYKFSHTNRFFIFLSVLFRYSVAKKTVV